MDNKIVTLVLFLAAFTLKSTNGQWSQPKDPEAAGGHISSLLHSSPTAQFRSTSKMFDNPCEPYNPPVPDFKIPGRRISEAKCYEYIWQLKTRQDKHTRKRQCEIMGRLAHPQIIGGHYTLDGEFPHMGAIGWKAVVGTYKFMCGSSLISSKFVLTAAHCSQAVRDTTITDSVPKIVRFGANNIEHSGPSAVDGNIIRIIAHPNYKSPKKYFDIALMELDKEMVFSMNVQPACLWTKDNLTLNDGQAQVAGWGVVQSGSITMSAHLLAAEVDIIDSTSCDALLRRSCNRNWCGIHDDQICAGKLNGGVDACQGDSGGPLCVQIPIPITSQGNMHYIIGVTSFGIRCAFPGLPGVYTRVSSFIDWIEKIVWPGL